jgi:hypothetical protein
LRPSATRDRLNRKLTLIGDDAWWSMRPWEIARPAGLNAQAGGRTGGSGSGQWVRVQTGDGFKQGCGGE